MNDREQPTDAMSHIETRQGPPLDGATLRSLIEQIPLTVYIDRLDDISSNVYMSPQLESLLGYPAEEWASDEELFVKVVHPEDRERVLTEHRRTRETGDLFSMEYRMVARDGSVRWFLDEATVIRDQTGQPAFHHGFYLDITERKELEDALRESEAELRRQKQYYESLLAVSPTAIVTIDLDDNVTSWNPAAEKLFGYTRADAIGRNIDELVACSDEIRGEAVDVNAQVGAGREVQLSSRRTRKDGTLVDVDVRAAPIYVGDEQVGKYAMYHDITALLRARRAAEAATEAKSAFLATMSHEIRTPMNAVIGMTELLLDTNLSSEQRTFADVIRTSGDALLTIINDILDFSKIEAGKLELEHQPFALRDCVESALDIVATGAAAKDLEIACLVDAEVPAVVVGDMTRLRQIVVNLLTNAVKFTETGEVVLIVACEHVADADGGGDLYELRFAVTDTGIGIPAERMHRLFESFSQVDTSTTRRYGGTGLGLAISKRLSEMMGGDMWVESEVGKGSTFHFAVRAEAAPGPAATSERATELRGRRILVVDDNAANREVVKRHVLSWGMVARATASPHEALEWIRRGDPFDVALLDMQMPELDGVMLAREIRKHPEAQTLPLVLLTSLGRRREELDAEVDFAAYLTKPIKASQLYEALFAVVGPESGAAAEQGASGAAPEETERAPLRILLAEDNPVNQRLALLLLEKIGYGADVASNGLEALEALRASPYDVVLMDVEMPEMDGLEASRRIHEWQGERRPRIIAVTANAMQGDRDACLAAGMDDYLSKPIRRDELEAALRRCEPRPVVAQAPPPQAADVLDAGALEELREIGGPAFLGELTDTFLSSAPSLVETLCSACAEGNAGELRRAAHTLKSNARTFGATKLAELCRQLEAMAAAGTLDAAVELVGQIEAEYERVGTALEPIGREAT